MSFSDPCRLDASYSFVPKQLRYSDLYGLYEIGVLNKVGHFTPRFLGYAAEGDTTLAGKFRFHGIPHAGSSNYLDEYIDVDYRRGQLHMRWMVFDKPLCGAAQLLARYGYGLGGRYVWNKHSESDKFWREHFDQCESCREPSNFEDCVLRLDPKLERHIPEKTGIYTIAALEEDGSSFRTRYVNCSAYKENRTLRSLFMEHASGKGIPFVEDYLSPSDLVKYYFVWKATDTAVCEMSRHLATCNCGEGTRFPWNQKIDHVDAERHVQSCESCMQTTGEGEKGGCVIS